MDAVLVFAVVFPNAVGFSCGSGLEGERTLEALELLVFVAAEYFLAVDVVHFDVLVPALAREDGDAAGMRTPIMVFVCQIVFLADRARVDSKRDLVFADVLVFTFDEALD